VSTVTTDPKFAFGSENGTAFSYCSSFPSDYTSVHNKNNTSCHLIQEIDSVQLPDKLIVIQYHRIMC
jgi:hypothetical protein